MTRRNKVSALLIVAAAVLTAMILWQVFDV